MFQGDNSGETSVAAFCPYSRLPVRIRPEWTDVLVGGDHRFTLRLIGEQILFTQPAGSVEESTLRTVTFKVEEIVESHIFADLPFVWISDYSGLSRITIAARKNFASMISGWPRLQGMVLFGLSPLFSVAARLGTRLKLVPFPVHIVGSYRQAIELATSILESLPCEERPTPIPPVVLTDRRWELKLDGYSIRFEVIDGSILHSVQEGRVREEHLDPIFELRDEVLRAAGLKGKAFSILAGIKNVEKSSHAGRLGYIRRMVRWYQDNPFNVEVFYGVNPLMRTVIRVSAAVTPFKVHVAKTYEEGLDYIAEFVSAKRAGTSGADLPPPAASLPTGGRTQEKIDELLRVLGAISWDTDDNLNLEDVDPSDPLAPVYEALSLVKTEIDDLLAQQQRDAIERRSLQARLARSEKMEALGLLAGGVAHDLNNVLSGIVSYPDLLLMDETLNPKTRRAIDTIKRSGEQAAAIVKDLMTISRGVATKTQPISLAVIVGEYLSSPDFVAMSSRHPGITIDSRLDGGSALVSGSTAHLRKVVANLVSNAFESFSTEPTGGRVVVETSQRQVDADRSVGPDSVPDGDYVILRIVDNGPGIDAKHQQRIFEPFFTKKIMGRSGTGLGLTVVWNTVQNHGGFIDLTSDDEGTSFDLYFPVTEEILPETAEEVPLDQLRGTGQRILVVDDVLEQREIAAALLVRLGYRVDSVPSGEAAIKRLRHEEFDLLLLDMLMEPGLNGRETYRNILEFRPGQKAVLASGYSRDEEVQLALALGAGAFITKPYSIEEIGVAVRDTLNSQFLIFSS